MYIKINKSNALSIFSVYIYWGSKLSNPNIEEGEFKIFLENSYLSFSLNRFSFFKYIENKDDSFEFRTLYLGVLEMSLGHIEGWIYNDYTDNLKGQILKKFKTLRKDIYKNHV